MPAASASTSAELPARRRRRAAGHPDAWLGALALGAWVAVLVAHAAGEASPAGHEQHAHAHAPGGPSLAAWALMVVAMMLPLARPHARWLALRSLRRRRHQAIAAFSIAYVAPWIAIGAMALPVFAVAGGSLVALAGALAVAAAWQVAAPRRRLLRRCGALRSPAIRGRAAVADWTRAGALSGTRCVGTCWALMLPMAIVHHPAVMALCATVAWSERRPGPNPETRGGRPFEANVLAVAAMAVLFLALVRAGG